MIITTQTAYGFGLLLISSFISGIALSVLYLILDTVPAIVISGKNVIVGYKIFREHVKCYSGNKYFAAVSDFLICIIAACLVCASVFIFNGGQFRVIPVAVLCLGFFFGKWLFEKILESLVTIIAFFTMKTLYFVSIPAVWLIRLLCRIIGRIIGKIVARHRLSLMKKYTKEQFDKLEAFTEFGLVDQGYKELIK